MANTYTKIYIQIIFAVKNRENIIKDSHREEVEKYICGIISSKNCKPLAIYCNPNHVHILLSIHPDISVSDLTRDIKANSSKFINNKKWLAGKFNWQDGFSAFTYSKSQINDVAKYILNQAKHHKTKSFKEEYLLILKNLEIDYDEKYLFDFNE